jgi:hypothetical protein
LYSDLPLLSRLNVIAEQWHRRRIDGRPHLAHYATQDMSNREVVMELCRLARLYANELEVEYLSPAKPKKELVSA